ncbi:ABC transporter ATP-binding protein [Herbidospora cretacea]|uniref:ABC transporter ATP-binding protein n=1 Tax=Herbidospora cretacea TaxID=28444 RepID=UPI0007748A10|nr:ABC transporter ATP-binding protein [Herbidospora cretacea]
MRAVLRRAISGQRRDVVTGAVLGAAHQAGEVMVPVLIGVVIDQGVARGDLPALARWLVVLAVVYVALSFSYRFGARAGERAAEKAAHALRMELVERVLDARGGAENGRLPGELTNTATEDAKRVGAVNMSVMLAVSALMGIVVAAVVLLRISVPLGLVVLAGTPLLLFLGHLLSKPLEKASEDQQDRAAHASGVAADLVKGLRVLKGIGAETAAVARYRVTSGDSLMATLHAARAEALQTGLVIALTGVFIAVVALVGGRLAASGEITLGELVAAVGLALFLIGPLEVFAWVNAQFAMGRASAARIAEVLAAPHAVAAGTSEPPSPVRGALRLRDLAHDTLKGVDLEVAPGEVLGVAAVDPADALALLRCLGRTTPFDGTAELDGVALADLDPAALRAVLLVADHDADLFEGTLRENVGHANPEVMAAAGADEVADELPGGVDGRIAERGQSLSGGQRQRVALARALAADRAVLVVHDPTTAVDAVTEARIASRLREVRRDRTTILVTTSPALLAVADRVVLLDGGRITDAAPHADLVRRNATYRTAVLA